MFFSITVSAADWPSTLYMAQTSFSSTGRLTATGADGVYEFTYTATSSTAAPKYYIFTTATSSTNAKKGTYMIYGASPIADGSCVQPEAGKAYPLCDISSAEDATALIASPTTCAFLPIYWANCSYKVTVNLNDQTVVFDLETPEVTSLGIFNKSTTNALSTADVVDGVARYSLKMASATTVYFSANVSKRADTSTMPIWGSSTQAAPENVEVATGNTYPLVRTTYYQAYSQSTCSFTVPAGNYDIIADLNTGKVEFAEYTGKYLAKPATLYMRNNTFGTSYASATGSKGVYTFSFDKSGSYTAEPFMILFSEVASLSAAKNASWILGSTTDDYNVVPQYGKEYPLAFIDPDKANSEKTGLFLPLYPQKYTIVVNLNDMTVIFNPQMVVSDLSTLYILNDGLKVAGKADKGDDGKYRYSIRGTEGTKFFFSSAANSTDIKLPAALNFGAGDHAAPQTIRLEYGKTYTAGPMSYRRVYTDKTGFFEMPGKCDIVFDPSTGEMKVAEYTGAYETLPDKLYLKINTVSSTNYATATGENGIYKFEYTTQGATSMPRFMLFCDATSYSGITPASWVLGGSNDGSVVSVAPGQVTPLYDIDPADARDYNKGCFLPIYPHTYTITLDLKNRTVTWGDPEPLPSRLHLLDNGYTVHATSGSAENGVYTIETVTYSKHPILISEATNVTDLRSTKWIYMGAPYGGLGNVDITDGVTTEANRTSYYHVHYTSNGFWSTPEGRNKLKVTVDTKANTVAWSVKPYPVRPTEVLYVVNRSLQPLAQVVSDKTGVFEFELNLTSSDYVGFSDSSTDKGDSERVFFGAGVPYTTNRITPQDGKEYPLYVTSPGVIADNTGTFYLGKGVWRVRVDLNENTVSFVDNSRGGVWYLPEAVNLCDDDLNVIAAGEQVGEGVFAFNGVTISDAKELTKVVIRDAGERGAIFGANATGEVGPTVANNTSYELYMPKNLWVVTDGASCFGLTPATYNITVDFVAKKVVFVDPSIPIYPAKMRIMNAGDAPAQIAEVSGSNGVYTFSLDHRSAIEAIFTDSEGTSYGAASANAVVDDGVTLQLAAADEPAAFAIPEGLWRVELNLAEMTVSFTQTARPVLESASLPDGSIFYSYFGAGTQPRAVFTFNNNLKSVQNVWVVLGDYAGGTPVESDSTAFGLRTASISENNLVLGFAGQHYEIPQGAKPKVHIVISTVVDQNGQKLESEALAGLPAGSLVFEYDFREFERIAIHGKSDIGDGENIDEISEITLSVNNFDKIKFDNVVFAKRELKPADEEQDGEEAEAQSEEVDSEKEYVYTELSTARWAAGKADGSGYTPLTVQVPMAVRGEGDVYLYLSGLDIDDGCDDHEFDVLKWYNTEVDPTVEVVATPEAGSNVESIDTITVTWTHPLIESVGNLAHAISVVNEAINDEVPGEVAKAEFAYTLDEKTLIVIPTTSVKEKGTYMFVFEAGDIVFNDDPASVNKPFALMYNLEPQLGIKAIAITDDVDVEVYDLSGIKVRSGRGISALRGLKGFYIVNGVKCYLDSPIR